MKHYAGLGCETRFLGPTNTKGARISARLLYGSKRQIIAWDYSLSIEANHRNAAIALLDNPTRVVSCASTGGGYIFIAY